MPGFWAAAAISALAQAEISSYSLPVTAIWIWLPWPALRTEAGTEALGSCAAGQLVAGAVELGGDVTGPSRCAPPKASG